MAIFEELSNINLSLGYDFINVWFYDMKSGKGMAYGMISQDNLEQEIKCEELK